MSTSPAPLNVVQTDELVKAVTAAINPEDIHAAILAEAQRQADARLVQEAKDADQKTASDKKAAEDAAIAAEAAKNGFSRTEVIAGQEFTFTGASELEVERQVNNAYRVAASIQAPAAKTQEPVIDQAAVAAAAAAEASAKAELEISFKRGDISAAEYIEKSGAVKTYLEKEGLSLDTLRATVEQNQSASYEQSWQTATEQFKNSPAGSDWPGGDKNLNMIGMRLVSMGLTDAKDKVAALAMAYADMKKTGMIFPGDAAAVETPIVTPPATPTAAEVAAATAAANPANVTRAAEVQRRLASTSSSLFDQSSGVSDAVTAGKPAPTQVQVDPNATPEQIMDAWKKAQVASGINPDAAFTDRFGRK